MEEGGEEGRRGKGEGRRRRGREEGGGGREDGGGGRGEGAGEGRGGLANEDTLFIPLSWAIRAPSLAKLRARNQKVGNSGRKNDKPRDNALKVTKAYTARQRGNPLPLFLGTFWQEAKALGYSTRGLSSRKSNIWIQLGQKSLKRERERLLVFTCALR